MNNKGKSNLVPPSFFRLFHLGEMIEVFKWSSSWKLFNKVYGEDNLLYSRYLKEGVPFRQVPLELKSCEDNEKAGFWFCFNGDLSIEINVNNIYYWNNPAIGERWVIMDKIMKKIEGENVVIEGTIVRSNFCICGIIKRSIQSKDLFMSIVESFMNEIISFHAKNNPTEEIRNNKRLNRIRDSFNSVMERINYFGSNLSFFQTIDDDFFLDSIRGFNYFGTLERAFRSVNDPQIQKKLIKIIKG